ncbi:hypothetical protein FDECE_9328 [Fusarium decemcellulare]|nr:hypothetical protein FDECE_9328 [Fusarium decemcellulare]
MAEVVGLIAASGQFIEQSIKIVQGIKTVYDKIQNAPEEIQSWQSQISSLKELTNEVKATPSLQTPGIGDTIKQCDQVSKRLNQTFERVNFKSSDSRHFQIRKAIEGLAKESEVQELFTQLERHRNQLHTQISLAQGKDATTRLDNLHSGVEDIKRSIQPGSDEDRCLRALFVTDCAADRAGIVTKRGDRTPKTCEWITSTEEYQTWQHSTSSLLWISGPPGKGKTYMSIFLSEHLEELTRNSNSSVIYFFCNNQISTRNTATSILRGLMFQLIEQHAHLISHVLHPWKTQGDSLFMDSSFESLWRIFQLMVNALESTTTYCVIDALDECDEASLPSLLKKLNLLFQPDDPETRSHGLKLVIFSRRYPVCLPLTLSKFPHFQLDDSARDVDMYISQRVSQLSTNIENDRLLERITKAFRERSEGTFLWVSFMAEELESRTIGEIEQALEHLPQGLDAIYERVLLQIRPSNAPFVTDMLRWVALASRPFSIEEMCTAVEVQDTDSVPREAVVRGYVKSCCHLLQITSGSAKSETISFVHQSAKDFVLAPTHFRHTPAVDKFLVDPKQGQISISNCLIRFISQTSKSNLGEYAAGYLPEHLAALTYDDIVSVMRQNPDFFNNKMDGKQGFEAYSYESNLGGEKLSWIHLACHRGIYHLVEHILRKSKIISRMGLNPAINKKLRFLTPLHMACHSGQTKIVELLLKHGANPHIYSRYTPLHTACSRGNAEIVELLLQYGADPGIRSVLRETPFHSAVRGKNEQLFYCFTRLEQGRQILAEESSGKVIAHNNLLQLAAEAGSGAVCQKLIEEFGYDVNLKSPDWAYTPLEYALQNNHFELARRFLHQWNTRIDPYKFLKSCVQGSGSDKSRSQIREGLTIFVKDLLCDINSRNQDGDTVLHYVYAMRNTNALTELLSIRADPTLVNQQGKTPLHSINWKWTDPSCFLDLLLATRLNINQQDCQGRTVLHAFCSQIFDDFVHDYSLLCKNLMILLDCGADRHVKNIDNESPYDLILRVESLNFDSYLFEPPLFLR